MSAETTTRHNSAAVALAQELRIMPRAAMQETIIACLDVLIANAGPGERLALQRARRDVAGEVPGRGRPRVDDCDVIDDAERAIGRGVKRSTAVALAVRELMKRENTDPKSINRRVRMRLDERSRNKSRC